MKKMAAILLAMTLVLSGCSGGGDATTAAPESTESTTAAKT